MPITFSSFGDIVAVLQLAWQLRAALNEASGASAEIRALVDDVDSFTRALQQIRAAIENRHAPLLPAVDNGIRHAVIACHAVLRAILGKVDAFRTRMTSRVGAAAWRQYWAVAAWSILGGKKDVDALRARLSEQIGVVQTYLALAHSNDQAKVQETVESQGVALERIYTVMQDIQTRFDVGVPSFHFYDEGYGYYTPFARTSFQRFGELLDRLRCLAGFSFRLNEAINQLESVDRWWPYDVLPVKEFIVTNVNLTFASNIQALYNYEPDFSISCCIFKERAFDQWQVLLGSPSAKESLEMHVLKVLVERAHPVGSRCHCAIGACRNRLEECKIQANHWRPYHHAMSLLDQVERIGMYWEDSIAHSLACEELRQALCRLDLSFIKHSILPLLRGYIEFQRPSVLTIKTCCESGIQMPTVMSVPRPRDIIANIGSPTRPPYPGAEGPQIRACLNYIGPSYVLDWL